MNARDRLVQSAQELLWERGYGGTSPKAVQERAGAGQGSMYHHFSGKADLALAALTRTAADERARASELLDGEGTPLERIVAYLERSREALRGCPVGRHAADPEVVGDPALRAPIEETFAWLRSRIAALVAQVRPDVDADQIAAAVVATVQGGYVLARADGSQQPFDDAVAGAVVLVRALSVPAPAA